MIRLLAVAIVALALAGCQSEAERRAEFNVSCKDHQFTPKQCDMLYDIAKSSSDASSAAANSAAMSGVAMGLSAGRR